MLVAMATSWPSWPAPLQIHWPGTLVVWHLLFHDAQAQLLAGAAVAARQGELAVVVLAYLGRLYVYVAACACGNCLHDTVWQIVRLSADPLAMAERRIVGVCLSALHSLANSVHCLLTPWPWSIGLGGLPLGPQPEEGLASRATLLRPCIYIPCTDCHAKGLGCWLGPVQPHRCCHY
jgi:hypothetical protein